MRNAEIASHFDELASLYELDGASSYRVIAYRTAAKNIRDSGASVAEMARQGKAETIPGIGKAIADKIGSLLEQGSIPSGDRLKERIPAGLVEVTRIPGLGPKRAKVLHEHLGIGSLDDLKRAAEQGRLDDVPGFGPKARDNVLAALEKGPEAPRVLLDRALAIGGEIVDGLRDHPAVIKAELAGSARRLADTVKDLDIVVAASEPRAVADAFAALPALESVTVSGEAGAKGTTHQGLPVELRIVAEESFGNLLQHFTGSGRHNEALRAAAVRKGLHVSEYGVLDDESGTTHAFADEDEVYALLGLSWIEPELREDRGELEAARRDALPNLITQDDLKGDLHCHTVASDGRNSIQEMALGALDRGYEYLAITDHSATHGFGNDVQADELLRQVERVRELGESLDGITLLAGTEVNVMPDGTLDYDDDVLAQLDWIVGSLHTSFRMAEDEMTARMITAIEHPLVDAIGHPTGRLIGRREPYALNIDRVVEAAARTGTFLEINANPNRRDLPDTLARGAAEAGVTLVVDSDAHGVDTLHKISYGVATARRAWLTPERVANTRSWPELDRLRKRESSASSSP
ncbi:MAG: DNA polymerase/3'-5' exonuclease PolX [Actinomycetota bacterium]|nr:DNA polymerase/3'-5' exonuclease PolX [Actinomycetota bacterium]MDQ3721393.1 DNA polymerase/3'-5' exonuclease PolX [Actinomycetota bacterium]